MFSNCVSVLINNMEDNASNKESHEENPQVELSINVEVDNGHADADRTPEPTEIPENTNVPNKKETGEKKERRITRLLTFWKKKEKTKDPISEENGEEPKNSPETERKKGAFSPSEVRRRAGSILKIFKPRSKSSLSPKKGKIEHANNANNAPKVSHDDGDLPRYRSYEQFERATAFQKSMSVQAMDMSDELLLAKQEYLQQYDANNNGAPLQRSVSYFEGSNSIVAEKKRGRGDSIRKEDLAKLPIPGPFFGVDVDSMYKFPGQKIPAFLALLITHIIKHGPRVRDLFATSKISIAQVQKLKNEFETASQQDIIHRKEILMNADIHTVMGLLLTWLNNLPSPLATVAVCEKLRFPIAVNHGQFSHSLIQSTLYNSLQPTQRRSFLYIISFLKQMIKLHDEQLHVKSPRPSDAYPLSEPRHSISVSEGPLSIELIKRDQTSSDTTKTDSEITPRDAPQTTETTTVTGEAASDVDSEKPQPSEVSEVRGSEKTEQPDQDKSQNGVSEVIGSADPEQPRQSDGSEVVEIEKTERTDHPEHEKSLQSEVIGDAKRQDHPEEKALNETTERSVTDNGETSRSESESLIFLNTNESIEESDERITMEKEFDNFLADFESKYEELFRKSFTTDDYSSLLQEVETKLDASFDSQTPDSFDLVEISKLFSESMFQISNHVAETANAISNLEQTLSALQQTVNNSGVEKQEHKRESLMQRYQEKTLEHQNMQQLRLGVMHYFLTEDILAEESGAMYLKSEKSTERFLAEAPKKVLIYKLLDHEYQSADPTYVEAFLLTYRYALPSSQLLSELIELYPKDNYMDLSQQTFDLRIRVCTVIKKWIEGYFYEMGEELDFIKVLKSFLKTHSTNITAEEQEFFRYFLTSIETWQELASTGHLRNVYNFPDFSTHKVSPTAVNRVTEVDPKVLAATLTLMDHQLFCNITMQEFLSNNNPITSLNSKQVVLFAKQFTALVQRTDKVCDWVLKEIFDASESKEKATTIKHFIKVAQECLQLKNYNGCYSIVSALNNNDVQNTIAKLHDKIGSHNIIALNSILDIFNPKDLYAAYQNAINSSETPCVPWIGLYQKYLSHLEETEPTFKSRANRIVNFNKMRKIYQLLQNIKRYQDSLFNYQLDVTILYYLLSVFNRPKFRPHIARQEEKDKDGKKKKKK